MEKEHGTAAKITAPQNENNTTSSPAPFFRPATSTAGLQLQAAQTEPPKGSVVYMADGTRVVQFGESTLP